MRVTSKLHHKLHTNRLLFGILPVTIFGGKLRFLSRYQVLRSKCHIRCLLLIPNS